MKRREFLKGFGALTAAGTAGAIIGAKVLKEDEQERCADLSFESGTLKRHFGGGWTLSFISDEAFDPTGRNSLVLELGGANYELQRPKTIQTEKRDNLFWMLLEGNGWQRLGGSEPGDDSPIPYPLPSHYWERRV